MTIDGGSSTAPSSVPTTWSARLRLGVTPSFHVNHVYYYGPELRDEILGPIAQKS